MDNKDFYIGVFVPDAPRELRKKINKAMLAVLKENNVKTKKPASLITQDEMNDRRELLGLWPNPV